jgi:cell wall-associated NlpC family hydrolase
MLRNRLASTLLAGAVMVAAAVSASAQDSAVAKPVAKPAAAKTTAKKKGAIQAVMDREASPAGPFAHLSFTQRDSVIEHTRSLLGVKYKWAGLNPAKGLDCSGIVKYVFAKLGVELPHRAAELAKLGDPVVKDTAAMQPGDLLVFGKPGKRISHVGIYVGDGKMIHASSSSHHVVETEVVKYRPAGGLQWKGVRRIVGLDSTAIIEDPEPIPPQH